MLEAFASRKSKMAWDVSEKLLSLEAVLVYTFGLMVFLICFEYWVKCGKGFVGSSGKCSQVARDQAYNKQ